MGKTTSIFKLISETELSYQKENIPEILEGDLLEIDTIRIKKFKRVIIKGKFKDIDLVLRSLNSELNELQFINCNLSHIDLSRFNNLKFLSFYGVNLNEIEVFNINENLICLIIQHCNLEKVPEFMNTIPKVKILILSHNNIIDLDLLIFKENLLLLDIRNNKLKEFPKHILEFPNLKGIMLDKKIFNNTIKNLLEKKGTVIDLM